jgi:hypothetical protein
MDQTLKLRDLIYFDFGKAASIFSQSEGGLIQDVKAATEGGHDKRFTRAYEFFKLFKAEFGDISTDKTSLVESRILHHDLLVRVEDALSELEALVDVNEQFSEHDVTIESLMASIRQASYVRAEGWAVLEDYERLKRTAANYNAIIEFIGKCALANAEQRSDEYKGLLQQLDTSRNEAGAHTDKNKRKRALASVEQMKARIDQLILDISGLSPLDSWLVDGIKLWIDNFMPGRINLWVCPFPSLPQFQIIANLKRDCFLDTDLEHALFAYGTRPNVALTILGLITSAPDPTGERFDPMGEYSNNVGPPTNAQALEAGFRAVFRGFEGMEELVRFSRYPRITVYPLAVYRAIRGR